MVVVSTNKENDMNESTLVPRKEISDLDWLVRVTGGTIEPWCEFIARSGLDSWACTRVFDLERHWFTREQYLARRAELQNKPTEWPRDANWLAQDRDGEWSFYTDSADNPPQNHGEDNWYSDDVAVRCRHTGEILGDWRDTLEKRPEQKAFKPFVSVEDAATAKQPAPKGSGNPILGMVLADLTNRALEGKEKYGEPLLAHNGRNPLWDAYQEALDLAMYLRQAIEEQK